MLDEAVKAILVAVVGLALKYLLTQIGLPVDGDLYNTLLAALVAYFLTLLGYETTYTVVRKLAPGFANRFWSR